MTVAAPAALEAVTRIAAELLAVPAADVKPESHFTELGADSLDKIELVMAFEDEFGIEVPDEHLGSISTVQDAVDYIAQHAIAWVPV